MENLQSQHKEWVERMYPGQPPEVPAAGVLEEAGELVHAVLKMEQECIWGKEARHGDLLAKAMDAVGDCCIYCVSLCNANGWEFLPLLREGTSQLELRMTLRHVAILLVREATYVADWPKDQVRFLKVLRHLREAASHMPVPFDRIVYNTWETVRRRTREHQA